MKQTLTRLTQKFPEQGQKYPVGAAFPGVKVSSIGAQSQSGARRPQGSLVEIAVLLHIGKRYALRGGDRTALSMILMGGF